MQVPLDALPLGVGRLDDARTGGPELVQARSQLGLEPLVLEREPGGGADCVHELGILAERGVVDERRDAPALPLDDRRRARATFGRELDGPAVEVDVAVLVREPVGERERRVVQRPGKGLAQPSRRAGLPQLDDEVGDRAARQPAAQEAELEREGHDRVGDEEREVDRAGHLADRLGQKGDAPHGGGPPPREEHRSDDAAPGGRGAMPALREEHEGGDGEDDPDAGGEASERLGQRVVPLDQREVLGVFGVVEQGAGPDDHRRVHIGRDDDRPRQATLEPAAREGEEHVREEGDVQSREEEADRVERRILRVLELAREPGEAEADHERADAVRRPAPPLRKAVKHQERPMTRPSVAWSVGDSAMPPVKVSVAVRAPAASAAANRASRASFTTALSA